MRENKKYWHWIRDESNEWELSCLANKIAYKNNLVLYLTEMKNKFQLIRSPRQTLQIQNCSTYTRCELALLVFRCAKYIFQPLPFDRLLSCIYTCLILYPARDAKCKGYVFNKSCSYVYFILFYYLLFTQCVFLYLLWSPYNLSFVF